LPTPSFLSCCGGCTSETKGERETHPSSFSRCGGCTSRKRDREKREIVQERCFSMEILKKVNEIKEIDQLQLKKEEDDGHDDDENKDEEDLN
jgi:hypothetical protein